MVNIVTIATVMFLVQLIHSIEESLTGFHKKWFLFKMSFRFFLTFEIIHNLFWLLVLANQDFPYRIILLNIFIVLMFSQSLWHLAWWGWSKKYVPGLITSPIHVALFLTYFFSIT